MALSSSGSPVELESDELTGTTSPSRSRRPMDRSSADDPSPDSSSRSTSWTPPSAWTQTCSSERRRGKVPSSRAARSSSASSRSIGSTSRHGKPSVFTTSSRGNPEGAVNASHRPRASSPPPIHRGRARRFRLRRGKGGGGVCSVPEHDPHRPIEGRVLAQQDLPVDRAAQTTPRIDVGPELLERLRRGRRRFEDEARVRQRVQSAGRPGRPAPDRLDDASAAEPLVGTSEARSPPHGRDQGECSQALDQPAVSPELDDHPRPRGRLGELLERGPRAARARRRRPGSGRCRGASPGGPASIGSAHAQARHPLAERCASQPLPGSRSRRSRASFRPSRCNCRTPRKTEKLPSTVCDGAASPGR